MAAKEVVSGLYQLTNGGINAFLVDEGDRGLTLIDAGFSNQAEALERDIRSVGREISDVKRILVTHAHPDHLGSAKHFAAGGARISLHPDDSEVARSGVIERTVLKPGPGLLNAILFRLVIRKRAEWPAFEPDESLEDGETLDIAGGMQVVHTPGHTAGHVSLLWKRDRGLLVTGDAAAHVMGLNYTIGYNDFELGKTSLGKLAKMDFEVAVFGHGRPILSSASAKFSSKFG